MLAPLALALAACGDGNEATGGGNEIVVAAAPALWERIERPLRRELEPTPFALPGEEAFVITPADPSAETWREQRRARHLLVVGTAADPWVVETLQRKDLRAPAGRQTELADVWARGQRVLVLALPAEDPAAALRDGLEELRATLDRRYREYLVERMYFPGGPDQAIADTLQARGGFALLVPIGTAWEQAGDLYRFRAAPLDSSATALHVTVTWMSPIPDELQGDALGVLEWRERIAAEHYGARQTVDPGDVHGGSTTQQGSRALQLLGRWTAGRSRGPFLMRAIMCPAQDRMYLLDGWLEAPARNGQEYMVQIESILNSFRCGSAQG